MSALGEWGFEHGDGWFAIVSALAEIIEARAPASRVVQCKEKFATLRVHLQDGSDSYCRGALLAAASVSGHVSELSGRPGRVMRRAQPGGRPSVHSGVRTLAPAESAGWEPQHDGVPDAPASAEELRARHPDTLDGATIAFPAPCFGIADGWLGSLRATGNAFARFRLARLGLDGDTAPVGHAGKEVLGSIAFLAALGRRVDRRTGAIGPVDNRGRLITPPSWASGSR